MFPCETFLADAIGDLSVKSKCGPRRFMSSSKGTLSSTVESAAVELDLRGLKCPLPAIKTRAALKRLPPGGVLVVATTDPLAVIDIPHLVNELGDDLLEQRGCDGWTEFRISRSACVS